MGFTAARWGYVAKTGDLDFAIAIRTAVCRGDSFEVTAGAGIVESSVPKSEADESAGEGARGAVRDRGGAAGQFLQKRHSGVALMGVPCSGE